MNVFQEILQEIQEGRTTFNPISESLIEMKKFQPIAKILLFANEEGLLEGYFTHKESETAYNFYDFVLVKGGLSHHGKLYLENIKNTDNIIQLKPSVYGIEIDLIALWNRWKAYYSNK